MLKNLDKLTPALSQYIRAAERRWPGCVITGNGPFACVGHDDPCIVSLHPTKARARKATDTVYLGKREDGSEYIRQCSVIDLHGDVR